MIIEKEWNSKMKQFKQFLAGEISTDMQKLTELLVDSVYSEYVKHYDKNDVSCVGWLDGTENAAVRFQKIYEGGISNNDLVLDVGCGVAHFHTYLKNKGWNGEYLGFDPNKGENGLHYFLYDPKRLER